jgi:hypothetical protein
LKEKRVFDDENEENIFGWVGLKDNGDHYISAVGLYYYFWHLKEDTRTKILEGWVTAIEAYLDPEFAKDVVNADEGIIYVSESRESVEDKPSGNIIPFPKR